MVSKKEIQAAWYISPHNHQITVSNSQDIKALVESLLNVVPPSFDPDNSIKHLRTDTGFILHSMTNFSDASLSPLYADDLRSKASQEVGEVAPRVQHSLECFMRFYMTSFHAPRDENAATEAVRHPDGSMASYMAGLLADCSQDLASPCDGKCRSAYASLDETQVEGLLYVSNLVTGYILGCMVGSEIAEGQSTCCLGRLAKTGIESIAFVTENHKSSAVMIAPSSNAVEVACITVAVSEQRHNLLVDKVPLSMTMITICAT